MLLNMAFSLIHLIAEICNSHGLVLNTGYCCNLLSFPDLKKKKKNTKTITIIALLALRIYSFTSFTAELRNNIICSGKPGHVLANLYRAPCNGVLYRYPK